MPGQYYNPTPWPGAYDDGDNAHPITAHLGGNSGLDVVWVWESTTYGVLTPTVRDVFRRVVAQGNDWLANNSATTTGGSLGNRAGSAVYYAGATDIWPMNFNWTGHNAAVASSPTVSSGLNPVIISAGVQQGKEVMDNRVGTGRIPVMIILDRQGWGGFNVGDDLQDFRDAYPDSLIFGVHYIPEISDLPQSIDMDGFRLDGFWESATEEGLKRAVYDILFNPNWNYCTLIQSATADCDGNVNLTWL